METVSLNRKPDFSVLEIPLLSRLAWEELIATLPKEKSEKPISSYSDEQIQQWHGLQISRLPGWEKIWNWSDDVWVFEYEKIQEAIAKRQRKAGAPQNGVFYTPSSVARYLTERTLGLALQQISGNIHTALDLGNCELAQAEWLKAQTIRVIDPACGTGVFLVEALKLFHRFYQKMCLLGSTFSLKLPAHHALMHQLSGIDLDPLSVMITEFRLAQWAARLDGETRLLASTDLYFHAADTLQDELPALATLSEEAGTQNKQWQFILGNPPYITEVRGQAQRFRKLQASSTGYYQSKMDLCDGFMAWGVDHLQPGGQLAYVLPAYWTQRSSTADLRVQLCKEGDFLEVWNFENGSLFKNAPGHHTGLMIWQKRAETDNQALINNAVSPAEQRAEPMSALSALRPLQWGNGRSDSDLTGENLVSGAVSLDNKTGKMWLGFAAELDVLAKLSELPPLLKPDEVQQGLVIPQSRLKPSDRIRLPKAIQEEIPDEPGVFVLNEAEQKSLSFNEAEQAILRPYYRPAGFEAFQGFPQEKSFEQIIYTDLQNRRKLAENPEIYARLRAHLDRFAAVNTSAFAPYGLHRARQARWFEDEHKILVPRQVGFPAFAVVPFPAYVNEGFLILRPAQDPYWMCAILNSNLAWFWFYHQKRKGSRLQIDKEVLLQFPEPPEVSETLRAVCISLAKQLSAPTMSSSARMAGKAQLNQLIDQAYQLTAPEIQAIESQLSRISTSELGA